jgi:hypothetical protein
MGILSIAHLLAWREFLGRLRRPSRDTLNSQKGRRLLGNLLQGSGGAPEHKPLETWASALLRILQGCSHEVVPRSRKIYKYTSQYIFTYAKFKILLNWEK